MKKFREYSSLENLVVPSFIAQLCMIGVLRDNSTSEISFLNRI